MQNQEKTRQIEGNQEMPRNIKTNNENNEMPRQTKTNKEEPRKAKKW